MDVIVIGCGAAGVAALRKLHDAGLMVMGLEADDRIGGRIKTVQFGENALDIGAAWCHGEKGNVVFELANPLSLLGRPSKPDTTWYLMSNGELVPKATSDAMVKILDDEVANADKFNAVSLSECIRNAARSNSVLKKNSQLTKSLVEWYERNNHVGGHSDPKKGKSLRGLEENWVCEGEFMLNWKGRGFKTILDVLMNKYPNVSDAIPVPIILNKEVEIVKWRNTQPGQDPKQPLVSVKCKDGSVYTSKSVIITMSIGVLKERYQQLFDPPLPPEKITAINTIQLCVLDKIYIEFTKPWWDTSANFFILWTDEDKIRFSEDEKWITELYGFLTVEHHPNLLLAWIYDSGAVEMERVSSEKIQAGISKLMDVVFKKNFDITPVKSILRSQWASNPLARGSYSYRSVATEERGGSAIVLSEPLYGTTKGFPAVCFAGEATSYHRHASVHGAVESGFREAERLITSIKKYGVASDVS